jgi:hypothetical protein
MVWRSCHLALGACCLLPVQAVASESEFQVTLDPLPKSYRVAVSRGRGDTQQSGRHETHVGVLADIVVGLPEQGFTYEVFPIGGIGLGYAFKRDGDFLDQALRMKFHYGLAWRPAPWFRFDVQPFLAPQGSFVTLPRAMVQAESERDWFLGGIAYGAEASVNVRFARWIGLAVRGGVEGDYVSSSNSTGGVTATLRAGGAVLAVGLILSSD